MKLKNTIKSVWLALPALPLGAETRVEVSPLHLILLKT